MHVAMVLQCSTSVLAAFLSKAIVSAISFFARVNKCLCIDITICTLENLLCLAVCLRKWMGSSGMHALAIFRVNISYNIA